ncbi:GNAT family N-acetyltransferase [Martelella lutilitoris]|uniref:GNAT family N-acetyltransferase n=1 Tax=Martelella lutilitoris TaxID=2583532 RepID=A0A5C4JQ01_9HYPH|nr:N-acetyltransferase [Martelella lutilitoris]TNB47390.1 GNAT family N-acetyltransferase [Martelella lutilitoris]
MTPRLAALSDLRSVEQLTKEAYEVYLPVLGYPPVPVTEDYRPRIARGEVFLFGAAAEPLGLCVVEKHADHLMLFSIIVAPAHQGEGYGRAMLEWLRGRARAENVGEIRLYTNALMTRNIALYERFGFTETGRRPNPKRPQFTIVDMAMPIED